YLTVNELPYIASMNLNVKNTYSYISHFISMLLLTCLLMVMGCNNNANPAEARNDGSNYAKSRGLERNPTSIKYSKHARCRMECRHITAAEVALILKTGTVNYRKSDLQAAPCKKRYAVEGQSNDGQHIRIIVAQCNGEATIITVIDTKEEWQCSCS
ncbi:MAG TPA: hypothetical protein DCQ29_15440, partial [Chitinophagaceae bacterium]|nr:hypothetical protein [Chitinophagaceae bacterium]